MAGWCGRRIRPAGYAGLLRPPTALCPCKPPPSPVPVPVGVLPPRPPSPGLPLAPDRITRALCPPNAPTPTPLFTDRQGVGTGVAAWLLDHPHAPVGGDWGQLPVLPPLQPLASSPRSGLGLGAPPTGVSSFVDQGPTPSPVPVPVPSPLPSRRPTGSPVRASAGPSGIGDGVPTASSPEGRTAPVPASAAGTERATQCTGLAEGLGAGVTRSSGTGNKQRRRGKRRTSKGSPG